MARISAETAKLAREAYESMELATKTYEPHERYVKVKDDAPEWVRNLVREAHGDMLPDDWRYDAIHSALETISDSEGRDESEVSHEFADSNADVYDSNLLKWVGSHGSRGGYVDEAVEEFGQPRNFSHSIQMGQFEELSEIFGMVLEFLSNMEDDEDETPTCDICDEPMDESWDGTENDWNGETGNHLSCEAQQA